jgi:hypothetical protein
MPNKKGATSKKPSLIRQLINKPANVWIKYIQPWIPIVAIICGVAAIVLYAVGR